MKINELKNVTESLFLRSNDIVYGIIDRHVGIASLFICQTEGAAVRTFETTIDNNPALKANSDDYYLVKFDMVKSLSDNYEIIRTKYNYEEDGYIYNYEEGDDETDVCN